MLHQERTDLLKIVDTIKEELHTLIADSKVTVNIDRPDFNTEAEIDRARFGQIIRNILANAIRFTPKGDYIHISIAQSVLPANLSENNDETLSALTVIVRDSGIGIPEDEFEAIFDKFIQSSKTNTGAGGTGLGLAIAKEIATAHYGTIRAANDPDGGACILGIRTCGEIYTPED